MNAHWTAIDSVSSPRLQTSLSLSLEFNTFNFWKSIHLKFTFFARTGSPLLRLHWGVHCIDSRPSESLQVNLWNSASNYRFCGTLCVRGSSEWHRMPNPTHHETSVAIEGGAQWYSLRLHCRQKRLYWLKSTFRIFQFRFSFSEMGKQIFSILQGNATCRYFFA